MLLLQQKNELVFRQNVFYLKIYAFGSDYTKYSSSFSANASPFSTIQMIIKNTYTNLPTNILNTLCEILMRARIMMMMMEMEIYFAQNLYRTQQ